MQKLTIALVFILFMACSQPVYENPHVIIKTGFGDIEVELYTVKAPKTTAAFLTYVDSGKGKCRHSRTTCRKNDIQHR